MRLGESRQKSGQDSFQWQHLIAWVGGILCALVPFIGDWEIRSMSQHMRQGPGNFGTNLLIGTGLCLIGGVVAGYWWRLGKWLTGKKDALMTLSAFVLLGLGVTGILTQGGVTHALDGVFFYVVGGVLLVGLVLAFLTRDVKSGDWPVFYDFYDWFRKKHLFNAVFFILLFIVLVVNNLSLIWGMEAGMGEKVSIFLGRALTQGVMVGVCYLLAELAMRSAPRYFRWVPWLVLGLLPLLVIVDQLLGIMWNRKMIHVVNSLTQSGKLDLAVELKTSGLDVGPIGAWLIVLGIFVFAMLVAGGCWLISKNFRMRISVAGVILISLLCWVGLVVEQGIGTKWQKTIVRQDAHKIFDVNLGLFDPPQGVGRFRVTFYPGVAEFHGRVPVLENKPDIFIFMMESTRNDAIRAEVAPFLTRFRDTECQPFDGTWSASNATHLSWFGFFHSRLSIFWREAREAITDREGFKGAIPLQRIKQAGYELEVRAVCDFTYKDFGFSNFGYKKNLLTVLEQAEDGNPLASLNISEREKVTFDRLRKSVLSHPVGGGFYFTALDSPHYNYYWPRDFDPPFKEYDEDTRFPLNPTEDEVQRVRNRYWNAVAWVDFQIGEFCQFLKDQGRYDESIIIVTGDHGEEFQEQGSWFHCSSLRPEQTNVPILIKWPASMGRGPAQKDVNHIDVMPSLLHALGMPSEVTEGMAGRNLLEPGGVFTSITATAYVGNSGVTMVLRRDGYEAEFSWGRYWESPVPEEMVLEGITGPDGKRVVLPDADAYAEELRRRFPDAFERFFKTLDVVGE